MANRQDRNVDSVLRVISDSEVRSVATMPEVIHAIEKALVDYSDGFAESLPRMRISTQTGTYRIMPAMIMRENLVGSKQGFWTSDTRAGRNLVMNGELTSLYDLQSGELLALINSHYLNQFRTAAAAAVGIKYLSKNDSRIVGLLGSGLQARTQIQGICSVRDAIKEIRVYGRSKENRQRFCNEMKGTVSPDIYPVSTAEDAIREADIAIEATSAKEPVFDGKQLKEGCHVVSIGTGQEGARTIDDETIRRASLIAVSSKKQAISEGMTEIMIPIRNGSIGWSKVVEIGDIVSGKTRGRISNTEITVNKVNGIGLFDIAAGKVIYDILSTEKK